MTELEGTNSELIFFIKQYVSLRNIDTADETFNPDFSIGYVLRAKTPAKYITCSYFHFQRNGNYDFK